jgi:hypothetical protein
MNRRRRRRVFWSAVALVLINAGLYASVSIDRRFIRSVAHQIIAPGHAQRDIVEAMVRYTRGELKKCSFDDVEHMSFLTRWNYKYNVFRVGPGTILTHGAHHLGPCQSNSRVFAELLRAHGIQSNVVALHDENLRGTHSAVQVEYEGTTGIVDPLYGIIYRHPDGRPATLKDLMKDRDLYLANAGMGFQYLPDATGRMVRVPYPVDQYTFDRPLYFSFRRFGAFRWLVYDALTWLFGEDGPRRLVRPRWFRFPAYASMAAIDIAAVVLLLLSVSWRRLDRRRSGASPSSADTPTGRKPPGNPAHARVGSAAS